MKGSNGTPAEYERERRLELISMLLRTRCPFGEEGCADEAHHELAKDQIAGIRV